MWLFWILWIILWTVSALLFGELSILIDMLFGAANSFLVLVNLGANHAKLYKIILGILLSTFVVYLFGAVLVELSCYLDIINGLLVGNSICRVGHIYLGFPLLSFFISIFGALLIFFPLKSLVPKQ
jgi:hypothetical protein